MISLNTNIPAQNASRNFNQHYGKLATSTRNLSSGLRINSAADDASGLAVRELMRTDIAAIQQGVRNASDAISMIQVADGALAVIDEKLIRMKELAEQAATGTYDSTQRLLIDSEFQAMGEEIDRIARATDFNGIKLLNCRENESNGNENRTEIVFEITDRGSINNISLNGLSLPPAGLGAFKLHIDSKSYINSENPDFQLSFNLTATEIIKTSNGKLKELGVNGSETIFDLSETGIFAACAMSSMGTVSNPVIYYNDGIGWDVRDDNQYFSMIYADEGARLQGTGHNPLGVFAFSLLDENGDRNNLLYLDPELLAFTIDTANNSYEMSKRGVELSGNTADYIVSYNEDKNTVQVRLHKGDSIELILDKPLAAGDTFSFDLNMAGKTQIMEIAQTSDIPPGKVKIHFGPMNDAAEDYYYIDRHDATRESLGLDGVKVQTQDEAQGALVTINDAIVAKDKIRAEYGAMQNRLENTITNLTIQAENLQGAESRISDADIATEMTEFVRNQVLAQSAIAMIAQANSMPQIAMKLIA